jgi:GNAT superfamily N-acetyltransferase
VDSALLASWNYQLIRDERHGNRMTVQELEVRMRNWLTSGAMRGVIFEVDSRPVGYTVFGIEPDSTVNLRHFFIARDQRRRGLGTAAMNLLVQGILPRGARITVVVLAQNEAGIKFWESLDFKDYAHILERRGHESAQP